MSRHFGGVNPVRPVDRAKNVVVFSLILLVALSSLGVLLLYSSSSGKTNTTQTIVIEKPDTVDMVDVVVPAQQIDTGTFLEPTMFRIEKRPRLGLSNRIVRSLEEINGYYAKSLIVSEQPLHGDFITKVKPNSPITANIPEGYRAVTIKVDARSSVEGWARPGAKVDVVWASTVGGDMAVTVIVQNAKVLSAERQTDAEGKSQKDKEQVLPSTVTLLVTSDDAAKIQLASTTGTMSLSLRGDSDKGTGSKSQTLTLKNLLQPGGEPKVQEKPEAVVRLRNPNGQYEELVMRDGRLVPGGR
jgi:pilus assembly protein CpaB